MIVLLFVAGGSALATYLGTKDHDEDHATIEIISHQRELTSRISLLALSSVQRLALETAIKTFEQNMAALTLGGDAIKANGEIAAIDGETAPVINEQLNQISGYWGSFRDNALELAELPVDHPERAAAAESLQASTISLITNIEQIASSYEQHMEEDLGGLRLWQTIFLFSTVPLLLFGIIIIRRRVLRIDVLLNELARGEDSQDVDLLSQEIYTDEVTELVDSFETMRPLMTVAQKSLEERVLHRSRKLMTAFEYSQEVVGQIDKHEILRLALIKSMSLVSANSSAICLIESDGSFLELSALDGHVLANIGTSPTSAPDQAYQVMPIKPGAALSDICQDCLFAKACATEHTLTAPLVAMNKQIGSICLARDSDYDFNQSDRQALQFFANSTAIAISNYRLTANSRIQEQQDIIKTERERLAAVLHDNLAQTLSYLNLQADRVGKMVISGDGDVRYAQDELASMKTAASSAYNSVRGVLNQLSDDAQVSESETAVEIADFIANYRLASGLTVTLSLDEEALNRLSPTVQQQVLHIIRESLTNTMRHAEATKVAVSLEGVGHGVALQIEDNGQGFDSQQRLEGTHLGLKIMQARSRRSGGNLAINSVVNQGTTISVSLPYQQTVSINAN